VSSASDRGDAGRGAPGADARHPAAAFDRLGLCPRCRHVQRIESARGSTFLLCTLARSDARFAKYPPQPQRACVGFEA
jgi:hypothetical protein